MVLQILLDSTSSHQSKPRMMTGQLVPYLWVRQIILSGSNFYSTTVLFPSSDNSLQWNPMHVQSYVSLIKFNGASSKERIEIIGS